MSSSTDNMYKEITLAIECSNPSASPDAHAVALFLCVGSEHQLIGSMPIPPGIRSSDAIMVVVDTLCAQHDIAPKDLARIIVSVGPGGYTALRISTTTAKVLAHTLGCELVALPTALVAANAIDQEHRPALIALASKNHLAHCSVAHLDGRVESVGVIDVQAIESLCVKTIFADAHLPESFVLCADELTIEFHPITLDARACFDAAIGIDPIGPITLEPLYAREPDAVTQWRERHPK